jgi:hypothetical protein
MTKEETREMYLEQYSNIQKTLVEGVKKVRQGLLDVLSAINGIHLFGSSKKINTEDLFWCDNVIRRLGVEAIAELAASGREVGLPDEVVDIKQPIRVVYGGFFRITP